MRGNLFWPRGREGKGGRRGVSLDRPVSFKCDPLLSTSLSLSLSFLTLSFPLLSTSPSLLSTSLSLSIFISAWSNKDKKKKIKQNRETYTTKLSSLQLQFTNISKQTAPSEVDTHEQRFGVSSRGLVYIANDLKPRCDVAHDYKPRESTTPAKY